MSSDSMSKFSQGDTPRFTSAKEVQMARRKAEAADRKVAEMTAQRSSGELENTGETKAEFSRLENATNQAKQEADLADQENTYDSALTEAADMTTFMSLSRWTVMWCWRLSIIIVLVRWFISKAATTRTYGNGQRQPSSSFYELFSMLNFLLTHGFQILFSSCSSVD